MSTAEANSAFSAHAVPSAGRVDLTGVGITLGQGAAAVEAVRHIDLEVKPGELVCVLGPSGCGKSTLLGAVAGFLKPSQGTVSVDGVPVGAPGADRGMVFQQHTLLPWRTVLDNVAFGLKVRGVPRAERRARARAQLTSVGLQGFEHLYPSQLSGGMQQRAELARVLINEPRVLLMDEPFGALDALTRFKMQTLLLDVASRINVTILFVTHDIDEALFLAERVVIMSARPGKVRETFAIDEPRPRTPAWLGSDAFQRLRQRCLAALHDVLVEPRAT